MWQVIINGPGYFDTQYELPDGETSLGRADENDIVLSGDLVSRRHAKFHAKGDDLAIEDLGSRNGSRINGEPLKGTVPLKVGDTLTVGENTLSVRQPQTIEAASTELVDTGVGGVRRFAEGVDFANAVVVAKNVNESYILRALDNVLPFSPSADFPIPVADNDKTPRPIPYPSLAVLYKTAEKLSTARTLQDFLDETTDRLMERVNATTSVVLLRNASGAFVPASVRHRGSLAKGEVPVSDAIIQEALKKKAALAVADVKDDQRFSGRESVLMYGADRVLCVPVGTGEPFAGVLYLNCSSHDPGSVESLLDLCNAVGHLLNTGIEKFSPREKGKDEKQLRDAFERFHAPEVVEQRLQEVAKSGGRVTSLEERTLTVLFADIAGFTALSRKLDPEQVVELLNRFYERMTGLVFSFEGTLDKFMGDAVVALFGAPYSKADDAMRAVRAALAMHQEWEALMKDRPPKERRSLRIGLNTGKALAGMVGWESRLDYTAFGEPVNVASWLCQSAEPGQVLITGKTLAAIGARFDVTPLGERTLDGAKSKVAAFEVVGEDVGAHTNPGVA